MVCDGRMWDLMALEASGQPLIAEAQILLVCCAETDGRIMRCGKLAYRIDVTIARDHLTLASVSEGLDRSIRRADVKRTLGIPERIRVVQLVPIPQILCR